MNTKIDLSSDTCCSGTLIDLGSIRQFCFSFHLLFKEAALYLNVRNLDLDFFPWGSGPRSRKLGDWIFDLSVGNGSGGQIRGGSRERSLGTLQFGELVLGNS